MVRFVKNTIAFMRGSFFSHIIKCFFPGKITIKNSLIKYSDVSINAGKNSKLTIGKKVKINRGSTISVLNGGVLTIADGVGIGANNSIVCHKEICIGTDTILGPNVMIYDHDHVYTEKYGVNKRAFTTESISIGSNCWLGANVVLLKGTKLGNRCVVGAGSVLKGEYPDDSVITQKHVTDVKTIERKKTDE